MTRKAVAITGNCVSA